MKKDSCETVIMKKSFESISERKSNKGGGENSNKSSRNLIKIKE